MQIQNRKSSALLGNANTTWQLRHAVLPAGKAFKEIHYEHHHQSTS
jgi:hypothetical protein